MYVDTGEMSSTTQSSGRPSIYLPSSPFSITTHLERSRESHIDIVAHPNGRWLQLASYLDMVLSHTYRWRSLVIDTIAFYDEPSLLISRKVLEKMNNLDFPSLKRVVIPKGSSQWNITHLRFIFSARSPALGHLELTDFRTATPTDFLPLALKTLRLNSAGPGILLLSLLNLTQTQLLVKLHLTGKVDGSGFRPNSILFRPSTPSKLSTLMK